MTTVNLVEKQLNTIPPGQPFAVSVFLHLGSYENIRQILSRFVKRGKIKRLMQGIFVKPEFIEYVGETVPSPYTVVQTIAQSTGETIALHGAETARQLELTTQVPIKPLFYTSGTSRRLTVGNQDITLQHVSSKKLRYAGTTTGNVLSALWYLGASAVSIHTLAHIKTQIGEPAFEKLFTILPAMPTWLSKQFRLYAQQEQSETL